jgi:hypothetical protein
MRRLHRADTARRRLSVRYEIDRRRRALSMRARLPLAFPDRAPAGFAAAPRVGER